MMDSPEARASTGVPWLFGRQGLGLLVLIALLAATFLATFMIPMFFVLVTDKLRRKPKANLVPDAS